ncbi:unnamed protein product [Mytilus coruscus]|uniref:Uncharacterized protein n=1 Tax=Mytilus coruscus TaxID=42192 RepID=A0A6J8ECD7_MYTCO|nr:unnamed protein product [Mytilus coruscus]
MYPNRYELALQEKNPNVMLPYWDSTLDSALETHSIDTVIFTEKFLGKAQGTVSVPFGGWVRQINREVKSDCVQAPNCGSKWLDCNIFTATCVSKRSEAALPSFTSEDVFEVHNRRSATSPTNNGLLRKIPLPKNFASGFPSSSRGQPGSAGLKSFASGFPSSSRGQPKPADLSGRKITAEEFFSALKTLKKQSITIASTPSIRIRSGTPGNKGHQGQPGLNGRPGPNGAHQDMTGRTPGRPGPPSNINTQHFPQRMPSIDGLKIPEFQKVCGGNPIQNSFRLDCKVGKKLWVFVPVKVVNLRHGDIIYASYPVNMGGRKLNNTDVFSDGQPLEFTSNLQANARSKRKSCSYDKSGLFKVRVSSYGLNYYGIYEDTVFLDNKRTVSTEISYIGIKNPEQKATRFFITAVDECGIACQPMILIPGRQKRRFFRYRKTQGAIRITANGPRYYSNTYRGAESLVWRTAKFSVPQQDENQIPIVFVLISAKPDQEQHNSFLELLYDHNLHQIVNIPTRKERILDLVLVNNPSNINKVSTLPPIGLSDHDIVYVESDIWLRRVREKPRKILKYNKANWSNIKSDLEKKHTMIYKT